MTHQTNSNGLYSQDMIEYVNSIDPNMYREALLHQIRLRDIMERDRDAFEKMYNDACRKLASQSDLIKHLEKTTQNQMNLEEELKKIDDFIKTPISERPRYKAFYEQVKQMADNVTVCPELGHTRELREAEVWMANRPTLNRIQQEESEEYLRIANYKTKLLFQLLESK